jgi:hypothetical protein
MIDRAARIGGEIEFRSGVPALTTWMARRFFTITGQDGFGDTTADITVFIARYLPLGDAPPPREGYRDAAITSDDDLLLQMIGSDNGDGSARAVARRHQRVRERPLPRRPGTVLPSRLLDELRRCPHRPALSPERLMRPKLDTASYRRATLGKALR